MRADTAMYSTCAGVVQVLGPHVALRAEDVPGLRPRVSPSGTGS